MGYEPGAETGYNLGDEIGINDYSRSARKGVEDTTDRYGSDERNYGLLMHDTRNWLLRRIKSGDRATNELVGEILEYKSQDRWEPSGYQKVLLKKLFELYINSNDSNAKQLTINDSQQIIVMFFNLINNIDDANKRGSDYIY
jgi:hypothetical protein